MGRFSNYVFILAGISGLLYYMGLLDFGSSAFLGWVLNTTDLSTSAIWTLFITAGLAGGVFVGSVTKNVELGAMSAIIIFTASFVFPAYVSLFTKASSEFGSALAVIILSPIGVELIITFLEWWRGRD